MNLSKISDDLIKQEYVKRFTISAGEQIKSSDSLANHLRAFFHDASKQEKFVCCFLNGQNQVINTEILFRGSLTSAAVFPREVVQRVLELGAAAICFGHNHPSGSIQCSSQDRQVTRKLQTALEAIDVEVLDHIIIGGNEFYSFADAGLLR